MLLGLIKASSGEVHVFSNDIKTHREEILENVGALVEKPS